MAENILVLVHGTFAREAKWISQDSKFAQALSSALGDCAVESFRWSGANNHAARICAGNELGARLKEIATVSPEARIHLVGHSHGGNVIIYALGTLSSQTRIDSAVFLGTPFLTLSLRDARSLASILAVFVMSFLIPITFFLIAWISILIADFFPDWWLFPIGFGALYAIGAVAEVWKWGWKTLKPKIERHLSDTAQAASLSLSSKRPNCRALIASVKFDEAGLWLGSADRLTSSPLAITQLLIKLAKNLSVGVAMAAGCLLAAGSLVDGVRSVAPATLTVTIMWTWSLASLGLMTLVIASMFASFLRGSPIAFGGESPLFVLSVRVLARRVPEWAEKGPNALKLYDGHDVKSGLRHSFFYESDKVIRDIVTWLQASDSAEQQHTIPESLASYAPGAKLPRVLNIMTIAFGFSATIGLAILILIESDLAPKLIQHVLG
jgi:hypothetical protein